jgi:hypothetical protein
MMGKEFKTEENLVRTKESHTTCLRLKQAGKTRYVCQTLGTEYRLLGPAAEKVFFTFPESRDNHDGNGGVYRGSRVSCQESGTQEPYQYACRFPQ